MTYHQYCIAHLEIGESVEFKDCEQLESRRGWNCVKSRGFQEGCCVVAIKKGPADVLQATMAYMVFM
jgi:hypothetical protein